MPASPTASSQPPPGGEACRPSPPSRKVHFDTAASETPEACKRRHSLSASGKASAEAGAAAAAGGCEPSPSLPGSVHASVNHLFSPRPEKDDSWTIEAQRSDRMAAAEAPGTALSGAAGAGEEGSPLSLLSGGPAGSYTPASAGFLESARKVDDLRGRLESLEAALKEMESKARGVGGKGGREGEGKGHAGERSRGWRWRWAGR